MRFNKISEVVLMAKCYYLKEGNEAGGSLHIVLDDGNIGDDDVQFCLHYAKENDDPDGFLLAKKIMQLTVEERQEVYENYGMYGGPSPLEMLFKDMN